MSSCFLAHDNIPRIMDNNKKSKSACQRSLGVYECNVFFPPSQSHQSPAINPGHSCPLGSPTRICAHGPRWLKASQTAYASGCLRLSLPTPLALVVETPFPCFGVAHTGRVYSELIFCCRVGLANGEQPARAVERVQLQKVVERE